MALLAYVLERSATHHSYEAHQWLVARGNCDPESIWMQPQSGEGWHSVHGHGASLAQFRVLIVEDNHAFREYLESALHPLPHLEIVGQAEDGLAAVRLAKSLQPDIVLLDIGLPELNGVDAAVEVRQVASKSKIVFVTQESDRAVVEEALSSGAYGYVLKARADQDLALALENVCRGEKFVSPGIHD